MRKSDTDSPLPRRRRLSSGALQRLEIAVGLADPAAPGSNAELYEAVREQAAHLLRQGEPAESVVTEIKREISDALARTGALRGDESAVRALLDQVVRWTREPRPARAD
jgi:hypothetical protein